MMTNYEIEKELNPMLGSDEQLIWTGKPKTGLVLRSTDAFLIPFSLLWGGFAIFWESTAVISGAPFFFKLWGIPFVLVGCYITVGRFFVDAKKRANTIYGITSDRIIIRTGIFRKDFISLNIKTLPSISIKQKSDNSGTINLGTSDIRATMMQGMDWPGMKQPPRLEMIPDVKYVYDRIIELQRQK